jgi:hypothetical protein
MCHSVEMYMPKLARQAAEHRLGAADFMAARRERAVLDGGRILWEWLRRQVDRLSNRSKPQRLRKRHV